MDIKEVRGPDGLYRCSVCGVVTRRTIEYPIFDGRGGNRRMSGRVMCKCQEAEEVRDREHQRREKDAEAVRELKKLSLMDEKLRDAAFLTYVVNRENQRAHKVALRYVEKFGEMLKTGQGLMFYGPVGTGKSYTAAAIANELMARKHPAVMTSFVKLLDAMGRLGTVDEEYIARLNHADILFIDDLGVERGTDSAIEKVYNIVDSRYRSCKPLILTTNLEMEQIKNPADIRYARIYDRVVEMCYPVRMGGLSWRKQDAARRFQDMKKMLEG